MYGMTKQIQAELLVLALVLLGSTRFLFISHTKKDSLSVVPLVGMIFSLFSIGVFGFSLREFIIFLLALWASIWNFRSVLRLASDVVIDRYDLKLVFISCVNAVLCIIYFVGVFMFIPAVTDGKKMGVVENVKNCTGSFHSGIKEIDRPFQRNTVKIWNFEPEQKNPAGRTVVLFVPPKTASVEIYRILLQKLAKNGYSVYAGDFWTDDGNYFNPFFDLRFMRRHACLVTKIQDRERYGKILKNNINVLVQEYNHLLGLAEFSSNDTVFLLSDEDNLEVMKSVCNWNQGKINGTFDLAFLDDHLAKGFGPVENTDPVLAKFLGLEIDRSGYISSHLAMEVTDFISRQIVQGQ